MSLPKVTTYWIVSANGHDMEALTTRYRDRAIANYLENGHVVTVYEYRVVDNGRDKLLSTKTHRPR